MEQIIKKGDKFNRLTTIRFDHKDNYGNQHWLFKCDCGNEKVTSVNNVKMGHTKSCGCLQIENRIKHKMCETKTYTSWHNMKNRCLNPNKPKYKDYGARGITICLEWMKFENFLADMGERPKNKTLDRINNSGNYEPDNCKWSSPKQQSNNTRRNHFLTFRGRTKTLKQWSEKLEINYSTLCNRINRDWSVEKALTFNI